MDRTGAIFAAATALGAAAFGWLCLHTDETGILAGSLLLLAFALGLARPRHDWAAALLGLAAPAAQALAHLAGWRVPYPNDWPQVAGAGVAVIFSAGAACAGALCGRTLARPRREWR